VDELFKCKDCGKEIGYNSAYYGSGKCKSCAHKGKIYNKEIYQKHYCIELNCNNEISYKNWKTGQGRCQSCANKSKNSGKKHTEESKRKQSEKVKGKNNPNFGNKWTEKQKKMQSELTKKAMDNSEIIERMRNNHADVSAEKNPMFGVHRFGKDSPGWQNGKSLEEYGAEFNNTLKELIRNRDNHKCQICGCPEVECIKKLSVHHIDYNKKNNNTNNLIALCMRCHLKTNYNRNKWEEYFNGRIVRK